MLIGSNPKKNEDPVAFLGRQIQIRIVYDVSRHVEILQMVRKF
jgi:hypothetical protein